MPAVHSDQSNTPSSSHQIHQPLSVPNEIQPETYEHSTINNSLVHKTSVPDVPMTTEPMVTEPDIVQQPITTSEPIASSIHVNSNPDNLMHNNTNMHQDNEKNNSVAPHIVKKNSENINMYLNNNESIQQTLPHRKQNVKSSHRNDHIPAEYTQYMPQQQQMQELEYSNHKIQQHHAVATGMYQPPASHLHPQTNSYSAVATQHMDSPSQYASSAHKSVENSTSLNSDRNHMATNMQQHYNSIHHSVQSNQQQELPTYDPSSFYQINQVNASPSYNTQTLMNSSMQGSSLARPNLDHRNAQLPQTENMFAQQVHLDQHLQSQQLKGLQANEINHMKHLKHGNIIPDVSHSVLSGLSQHSQQQIHQQMYLSQMQSMQRQAIPNMYASNNLLQQHNLGIGYSSLGSKFQMPSGLSPQQQQAWLTSQNYGHGETGWR